MEISSRYSRSSQQQQSSGLKQRRSGYEPSDTETDWHDSPGHKWDQGFEMPNFAPDRGRNISPLKLSRRQQSATFDDELSKGSSLPRRHSKSPYKPSREDTVHGRSPTPASSDVHSKQRTISPFPPKPNSDSRANISPFSKSERRRHVSPYKPSREDHGLVNNDRENSTRRRSNRQMNKNETSRVSEKSNYSLRSVSAPRPREKDQSGDRKPSPLLRNSPLVGELNEMVANAKISRAPASGIPNFGSTDSIAPGDIFFSRDYTDLSMTMQKITFPKNSGTRSRYNPKPQTFMGRDTAPHQRTHGYQGISSSAVSRQSSGRISTSSSKQSDATNGSSEKFAANRRKTQKEAWLSCIRNGPCKTSKSPEKVREFDEASFIGKAFVVESLRQFWADKHQPASLTGFICHKQQAQQLNQLVSSGLCPHILLKGPRSCGKKSLAMGLLHEIYGDAAWNISHDVRCFNVQESRPMQIVVPVTSSPHHVELNAHLEPNAAYAIMALVKEISSSYAVIPEISMVNFKADYKVMVLYDVEKAAESVQHLIKWVMDCYTDSCKLILCCEDDIGVPEAVRNGCKLIKVDPPVTHEIVEVLVQVAKKENFELPTRFAVKIATKSKQNLRKAIMALEACKAHNYPFVEDQPIPLGWEEVVEEVAAEVLADPSQKRLFSVRGKFQKLLVDFVHPKLILQKLVEQFLRGVEASLRRDLYYWHGYYEKRLPIGTSALLKLEEFIAKFMSMHRKSTGNPPAYRH